MKIEFTVASWEDFSIGISMHVDEDEDGLHRLFTIGLLFFGIEISYYSDDINPYDFQ